MSQKQKARKLNGRKDHWLPQGYMRGFVAPSRSAEPRPLFCFDRYTQKWSCVSTSEIGFGNGFYDYARGTKHEASKHPDSVFARLEREFPQKREQLAANRFESWEQHKDFLIEFMQMIRARSPLAMEQHQAVARSYRGSVITSVAPDRMSATVDSMEPRPLPGPAVRNITINRMLEDVQAGASWGSGMDWCLRYTDNEADPFCTTDQAAVVRGSASGPDANEPVSFELLAHPETLVIFPLCWQSCLFGSPRKFDKSYDLADPQQLEGLRHEQKERCNRFVIAPMIY